MNTTLAILLPLVLTVLYVQDDGGDEMRDATKPEDEH